MWKFLNVINTFRTESNRWEKYGAAGRIITFLLIAAVGAGAVALAYFSFDWWAQNFLFGLLGLIFGVSAVFLFAEYCIIYAIISIKSCFVGAIFDRGEQKGIDQMQESLTTDDNPDDATQAAKLAEEQRKLNKRKKLKWLDIVLAVLFVALGAGVVVALFALVGDRLIALTKTN